MNLTEKMQARQKLEHPEQAPSVPSSVQSRGAGEIEYDSWFAPSAGELEYRSWSAACR